MRDKRNCVWKTYKDNAKWCQIKRLHIHCETFLKCSKGIQTVYFMVSIASLIHFRPIRRRAYVGYIRKQYYSLTQNSLVYLDLRILDIFRTLEIRYSERCRKSVLINSAVYLLNNFRYAVYVSIVKVSFKSLVVFWWLMICFLRKWKNFFFPVITFLRFSGKSSWKDQYISSL